MIKLSDFNHLRNDPRIKFKTELVDGQSLTIISYMIADSKLWTLPLATECRGITFNEQGECISRPLHKFFNIGEREETLIHNVDFTDADFIEKRDGSMLIPVSINSKIHWKSKKSFFSDVAVKANQTAPDNVLLLAKEGIAVGYTPIFEFTHPEHQIVIDYGNQPKFVLIAIRNTQTGEYLSMYQQQTIANLYGVESIQKAPGNKSSDEMIAELETVRNFEGWVVRHKNGMWTKAKSKWYLINHRIMTEMRERDIALAVIEETVDDIKSMIVTEGKGITPILEIENRVVKQLESIMLETEALAAKLKATTSRKEAAEYRHEKYFGLAILMYDGKEPDYKKYFVKNCLKVDFSLRVIYNQSFNGDTE